ncbi:MAG: LysM peptidoglycan-binding domain-containing protein [Firmicutes bacterium]|nr:LysM peptidoglycan-binding domain-containing protein [Bacillota bacterium]
MFEKYKLKYGESLKDVANRFETDENYLKDINNIYFSDQLKEGMDLVVPKNKNSYYEVYTIEKGDSMYQISKKYNINPQLLESLNGLDDDDYIYPGQDILIPKSGYSYYITKEGDTIESVMKTFNTTKDNFEKYNQTIYLLPGQLLVNKNR